MNKTTRFVDQVVERATAKHYRSGVKIMLSNNFKILIIFSHKWIVEFTSEFVSSTVLHAFRTSHHISFIHYIGGLSTRM